MTKTGRPREHKTIDTIIERFVIEDLQTECWNWTGAKHRQGYNLVRFQKQMHRAERLIKETSLNTSLKFKDRVINTCGNMDCVNPDHYQVWYEGTYEYPHGVRPSRFTQEAANELKAEWDSIQRYHGKRKDFSEKHNLSNRMLDMIIKGQYVSNRGDK